jgi:hypothetical protein
LASRIRCSLVCLALALAGTSASGITYDVTFTGGGPIPTGSITFANVGDVVPSTYFFSDGTYIWTPPDNEVTPFAATWAGSALQSVHVFVEDDALPGGGGSPLQLVDAMTWATGSGGSGTYSLAVPEPMSAALLTLGLVGLAVQGRRPRERRSRLVDESGVPAALRESLAAR